jgi:hypothetical protein
VVGLNCCQIYSPVSTALRSQKLAASGGLMRFGADRGREVHGNLHHPFAKIAIGEERTILYEVFQEGGLAPLI